MKQTQKGFTLIELVMVIVILGVLAATALPKFVDLKSDANKAAASGFTGALASANAINYGTCSIKSSTNGNANCTKVQKCSDLKAALNPALASMPVFAANAAQGTVNLVADTAVAVGALGTCTIVYGDGTATGVTTDVNGATLTYPVNGTN